MAKKAVTIPEVTKAMKEAKKEHKNAPKHRRVRSSVYGQSPSEKVALGIEPEKKTLAQHMIDKHKARMVALGLPVLPFDESTLNTEIELTKEVVTALGVRFLTANQVANVIGCDPSLVLGKFEKALLMAQERSKTVLRDKMLRKGMDGDTQMMVWLSKQYLGMREPKADEAVQTVINVNTSDIPKVVSDVIEVKGE